MSKEYLEFERLNNKNIINFFSYKPFNFKSDLSFDEIENNYNKFRSISNCNFKVVSPIQKHTNIVKIVNKDNIDDSFDGVDGLITNLKNVALGIKVADCQAIMLYDDKKKVIGNIHSGWKGTLGRIIKNGIELMINNFNSNPKDIEVYICPSILKCCFEVDKDVKDMFMSEFKDIDISGLIEEKIIDGVEKYYIDTVEINKRVLINLGIKKENIITSNICSKCNNSYIHSYRGDKPNDGRNISLICMSQ